MSNKMWGGRFTERPDSIMEEINVSIDVDRHLYAQDIAASKAHAAMLSAQGIITPNDAKNIAKGLDTILSEIGKGSFDFQRALEERSGRHRFSALCPRHRRRDRCRTGLIPGRAGDAGAGTCRDRDARVHASADRAAGHVRAPSAGLCRDGIARSRPLCRCTQTSE